MSPVITQIRRSHPPPPTVRAISALTMKIPDPIIEPMTSIVPSNRPRALLNSCGVSLMSRLPGNRPVCSCLFCRFGTAEFCEHAVPAAVAEIDDESEEQPDDQPPPVLLRQREHEEEARQNSRDRDERD